MSISKVWVVLQKEYFEFLFWNSHRMKFTLLSLIPRKLYLILVKLVLKLRSRSRHLAPLDLMTGHVIQGVKRQNAIVKACDLSNDTSLTLCISMTRTNPTYHFTISLQFVVICGNLHYNKRVRRSHESENDQCSLMHSSTFSISIKHRVRKSPNFR